MARQRVAIAQAASAARRFESCCLRFTMRRRPTGRTTGCYPVNAGSTPAVAVGWGNPWFPHRPPPHADRMDPPCLASRPAKPASGRHGSRIERSLCLTRFTPRSSSGSRMPASQAGDAGSNPARGLEVGEPGVPPPSALGRVWRRGLAVSRVRRVRFPSRALLAVAQWTSTTLLPWPTGVRLLPARLRRKASSEPSGRDPDEQGAIPWRRPILFASRNPPSGFLPLGSPPAAGQIPEGVPLRGRNGRGAANLTRASGVTRRQADWQGAALIRR